MYQRAIGYAQSLVDSGYITDDYVQLYELKTSEFSSIYSIFGTDTPISDAPEYPSRIVKVGEKVFLLYGIRRAGIIRRTNILYY